jgi:hypothetical protein
MPLTETRTESTHFRVINSDEFRSDLALRREAKFALPGADVGKVRDILASNLRRQIHNDRVSGVRSVYFDDARFSCCHANLSGLTSRRKLRIRWYDLPLPGTSFFVEVKWRENQITGKRRWQIETASPLTELSYRDISRQIVECVGEGDRILAWQLTEPVAIVEYQREHFVSACGDFRFTLDYDLRFTDQTCRTRMSTGFATEATGLVIIEGKCPPGRDGELRRLLHPLAPRVTSSSKYVLGCQLLGLAR